MITLFRGEFKRKQLSGQLRSLGDDNPQLKIIILSSHTLTSHEIEVLRWGLSFCPKANTTHFDILKGFNLFARLLTYKFIFDKERQKKKRQRLLRLVERRLSPRFPSPVELDAIIKKE